MQNELTAQYPLLRITLAGVNQVGHDSGNSAIVAGRDLTFLQDVDANQNANGEIWDAWQPEYRDVVILGGNNEKVGVYNLTVHDLATAANYAELKDLLIHAAMDVQKPWQNARDRFDVDNDRFVVPMDALQIINTCNAEGPRNLAPPTGTQLSAPYYDVDGDNFVASIDALQILNFLNAQSGGEGESSAFVDGAEALTTNRADVAAHDQFFQDFLVGDHESQRATWTPEPARIASNGETRLATLVQSLPPDTAVVGRTRPGRVGTASLSERMPTRQEAWSLKIEDW